MCVCVRVCVCTCVYPVLWNMIFLQEKINSQHLYIPKIINFLFKKFVGKYTTH